MRKYFLRTCVLLLVGVFCLSCGKSDNGGDRYTISGNGSGNQEVPAVSTNGTVTITGTYNSKDKAFTYNVSFANLTSTPVMMHFHGPADPGANADILVPVTGFPQAIAGNFSGAVNLTTTAAQESALLAGKMYFNIHTTNYPNGEIRAQIGLTRVN